MRTGRFKASKEADVLVKFVRMRRPLQESEKGRGIAGKANNTGKSMKGLERCDSIFSLNLYSLAKTEAGKISKGYLTKQPEFFQEGSKIPKLRIPCSTG